MQLLTQILKQINDYVWGLPLICLLLGTGIYFTFKLRLIQLTKLKLAFKCIFKKQEGDGDVSSFQALCTALSSTIGTGITMVIAMQKGISRGIFSNESGLGSAPIAAAAAKTDSCVEQGLVSMTGTFIDTIVICTMTGLAIVLTQSYTTGLDGAAMTTHAFSVGLFIPLIGKYIVNIGLVFFAFTTIIGWNYYGERCMYYLKGLKAVKIYKIIYILFIAIGPFMSLEFIFVLADIVNGCMAIPNLIGLIGLRKEIVAETEKYFEYEQPVELVTNIEG